MPNVICFAPPKTNTKHKHKSTKTLAFSSTLLAATGGLSFDLDFLRRSTEPLVDVEPAETGVLAIGELVLVMSVNGNPEPCAFAPVSSHWMWW